MQAGTRLGISPGTRILGLAVMRKGELIEWRVKSYKEKWSKDKQKAILSAIENLCDRYEVTLLSVKKTEPSKSSPQLLRLQAAIVRLAERKRIDVEQYSLSDLDYGARTEGNENSESLSEKIASRHPALRDDYVRERSNRREYYTKMFEAIAMAEASREL